MCKIRVDKTSRQLYCCPVSVGLIRTDSRQRPYIYHTVCTRDEFFHHQTTKLIKEEYDNSLGNFIASFVGGQSLSTDEVQALRDLLDQLYQDASD